MRRGEDTVLTKRARNFAVACAVLLWSGVAQAEDWPSRAVTIVVPFAAGGTTDMVARPIAQVLSQRLGQPVVVDNLSLIHI